MATRSASIIQSRSSNEAALQVLRKLLSPSYAHHAPRRRVLVDSLLGATFMKTMMDSVNEITPDLFSGARHSRAVKGHAADTADSRRRAPKASA